MEPIAPISLDEIDAAAHRIRGSVARTPMVTLERPGAPCDVRLKLECLQPIGSFKLRGAAHALAVADPADLENGVYTGSAGNMAQGVAWAAREMGLACRVIVPDTAPRTKLRAVERLGGVPVPVPFDEWWAVLQEHGRAGESGFFVHPVADPAVIAGNGTVGLELLEDAPDLQAVVVPFGGGGLACGIASAVKALRPDVRVYAAEAHTAAPYAASLRAGEPVAVDRVPSFVDGIGGGSMLPEMWPLASTLLDGSIVVSLEQIRSAIRILASEARVVAEGAGAAALAACLTGAAGDGVVAAVVSGGNIDADVLGGILMEEDAPTAGPPERP